MRHTDDLDDPRRRILIQALAAGVFSAGLPGTNILAANLFGSKPAKLPPDKSIYRISGQASVNGKQATLDTLIKPGDTIQTAKDSEIIFVVNGNHSMILRSDSHLLLETEKATASIKKPISKQSEPESTLISGLKLLAGKLLSVSRNTPMRLRTVTAVVGIRGTGFYVEADPEQTYFCTCYGTTDVASSTNPASQETILATHHDRPVYIINDAQGKNIRKAPLINHTDLELSLIETLVGRTPPFVFANDDYAAPRRDY